MKDLNFFEPYTKKQELHIDKQWIYHSIIILLFATMIFYSLLNQIKISKISKDINKIKTIAEDSRINVKVKGIKEKENEVNKYVSSFNKLKLLDETVEDYSVIDDWLLDSIKSKMPDNLFFTSISMYIEQIEIVGASRDKWSIADFGKGLESIEDFREIFISSISKEDQYYNFIININLKEVNLDEEDQLVEEDETRKTDD